jgi:hypothetical protein
MFKTRLENAPARPVLCHWFVNAGAAACPGRLRVSVIAKTPAQHSTLKLNGECVGLFQTNFIEHLIRAKGHACVLRG